MSHRNLISRYLELVGTFTDDEKAWRELIHPEAEFYVLPNPITPFHQKRNAEEARVALKSARSLLESHAFEPTHWIERGDDVVLEVVWKGKLAVDAGPLRKGMELKAYCCMVFRIEGGKIREQKNYDCYEPFK